VTDGRSSNPFRTVSDSTAMATARDCCGFVLQRNRSEESVRAFRREEIFQLDRAVDPTTALIEPFGMREG
jgi:hypothetical protein